MTHTPAPPPTPSGASASTAAPLWAVGAFTVLNSLGTGIINNGIYFLATNAYDFTRLQNYALAVLMGVTYIAGALGVGPALQRLCDRVPWLSHRLVLAAIMIALALFCLLPWIAAGFTDKKGAGGQWAIWALAAAFGPLTGALWPITESYVSGGRRGHDLRHALGTWNIVWSASVAAALWMIAPLVQPAPRTVLAALAGICLLAIAFLPPMGRDPGRHLDDDQHEVPPDYERLLAVFRILLPTSYFVISALGPNLPTALASLGVAPHWHTPLTATWTLVRVPTFILLARWHGWHGQWWMPHAGIALLGTGFTLAVLGPALLADAAPLAGIIVLELGLTLLGLALATIYVGALYYVSAARHGAVSAGGSHEALIGVGYVGGPAFGLGAAAAVHQGLLTDAWFAPVVLGLVALTILAAALLARHRARHTNPHPSEPEAEARVQPPEQG